MWWGTWLTLVKYVCDKHEHPKHEHPKKTSTEKLGQHSNNWAGFVVHTGEITQIHSCGKCRSHSQLCSPCVALQAHNAKVVLIRWLLVFCFFSLLSEFHFSFGLWLAFSQLPAVALLGYLSVQQLFFFFSTLQCFFLV